MTTPTRYVLVHLPTGAVMTGTLERLYATASFSAVEKDDNGVVRPCYDGDTEVHWDSQETMCERSADGTLQRVFLDDNCHEYLESDLTLMDYAAYKALES